MKKIFIIIFTFFCLSLFGGCAEEQDLTWLEEKQGTVYKCIYQEETAYYNQAPCCDQDNNLYDQKGIKICAASGGFTGSGDGQCPDFKFDDANCQLNE